MKKRCFWVQNSKNSLMVEYHDREWGRPNHHENTHFEMITLEGAQAGLSWEIVLNKRAHYRKVFAGFDPKKVARFSKAKIEKLLNDPGIIRNRLKVESTVSNAKLFLEIQREFGSFDNYIWGYFDQGPIQNSFKGIKDYPTKNNLSDQIAKDLKMRGFRFVGTTIIFSYLEACGMMQNHTKDCYLNKKNLRRLN